MEERLLDALRIMARMEGERGGKERGERISSYERKKKEEKHTSLSDLMREEEGEKKQRKVFPIHPYSEARMGGRKRRGESP